MTQAKTIRLSKAQEEIVKYMQNPTRGPIGVFNYSKPQYLFQPTWYNLTRKTVKILIDKNIIEIHKPRIDEYIMLTILGKTINIEG